MCVAWNTTQAESGRAEKLLITSELPVFGDSVLQCKPGNQRRGLKLQKPNNETSSLFQTTCRGGRDDAGVGIQRLKGICSASVLSSLQLQDVWVSSEAGEA